MKNLLEMNHISKNFGSVQALSDVSIVLNPGEVLALMGENGAGKSTLMNILNGALVHYDGDILLNGEKVTFSSPLHSREHGIAKIHQELQLVDELTIAENMYMGREITNKFGFVDKKKTQEEAQKYLDMLGLGIKSTRLIKSLRVGEQQMVEIAKAVSLDTKILIMDEPTSAISKAESEKLFKVIRQLLEKDVAIIYITHRMEEVFVLADRLTVFRDGKYVDTVDAKNTSRNEIIAMMVGREIKDVYPKEIIEKGDVIFEAINLCLDNKKGNARGKRKIQNISFKVKKGEVLGVAGLMGSGRSELLETIFGVYPHATTGTVKVEGKEYHFKSPREAIDCGLAFATEDRKGQGLVLLRSIGENMSLPKLKKLKKILLMDKAKEHKQWDVQMKGMRIKAPSYDTLAKNLSGGNQQKVVLGKWMMIGPKILLLDEPTRGIDVGAKAEIYQLINDLTKLGMAIIMVSSELPEVIGISDRIITLCEGKLTGTFDREEATQEKLMYAATLHNKEEVV